MTPEQKNHISRLLREYSGRVSTETLINFVADTNGMISACRELLRDLDSDRILRKWLEQECDAKDLEPRLFLDEIAMITKLFHPEKEEKNYHAVLGLEPGASPERIKQAYRRLSMKYHPDTAVKGSSGDNKKFIQISCAYQALQESINSTIEKDHGHSSQQWRTSGKHYVSSEQKKWFWVLLMAGVVVAIVVITVTSVNYRKRVMLHGLQQGRGYQTIPVVVTTKSVQVKSAETVSPPSNQLREITYQQKEENETQAVEDDTTDVRTAGSQYENVGLSKISGEENTEKEISLAVNQGVQQEFVEIQEQENTRVATLVHSTEAIEPQPAVPTTLNEVQVVSVSAEDVHNEKDRAITPQKLPVKFEKPKAVSQNTPKAEKAVLNDLKTDLQQAKEIAETVAERKPIAPLPVEPHEYKRATKSPDQHIMQESIPPVAQVVSTVTANNDDSLQERIDAFLRDYNAAYEERNIILFSRFFEVNAIENGEPFIKMMAVYTDLFESTSSLALHLQIIRRIENDGEFELTGRFRVYLDYKNGKQRTGSGPIKFILREVGDALRIKELEYTFNG